MHGRTEEKDLTDNEFQTVQNKKDQKIEAKVQGTIDGKEVERSWKQRQARRVRELVPLWDGNLSTATPEVPAFVLKTNLDFWQVCLDSSIFVLYLS